MDLLDKITDFVNECLGPLGSGMVVTPDTIRDLLIQLIATLILFIVVKIFFWNKITNFLEARKNAIDEELTKAQDASKNAAMLESKLHKEIEDSKIQIQTLIATAVKEGNVLKDEIVADAKKEAELRLDNARKEIEYDIKKQQQTIKDEIITIAFAAAEKIVAKEVDKSKHLEVVNNLIESGLGK
ncbi:MAG: F0F1 ATP synthase subunit B [bacterium]